VLQVKNGDTYLGDEKCLKTSQAEGGNLEKKKTQGVFRERLHTSRYRVQLGQRERSLLPGVHGFISLSFYHTR
jgi:hypothetical protein